MMNNQKSSVAAIFWSNKWALSLSSGLLLGLSFPPFPFPFLIFPAWVLLFRLADLCRSNQSAAYWSYISFVVWNLITTYWLMMATVAGGIAAILANSAVMTIPFVLHKKFQEKYDSPWLIAPLQAAVWICYEYLNHQWELAWPWLTLGNAWSNAPGLIQYISVTGYWSISFWILIAASLAYQTIRLADKKWAYASLGVALIFPAVSLMQYQAAEFTPTDHIKAVVVQPNFDTYHNLGGYEDIFQAQDVLYTLSDSVRTDSTDLIIWPENAVRTSLRSREVSGTTTQKIKDELHKKAATWNVTLITGSTYFDFFSPDSIPPLARSLGRQPHLYYNAALGFYPQKEYEVYRKHNLVPIVERIPFIHLLSAIDVLGWVDWRQLQGYGKGRDATQFQVDGTATPALVCYDSVFPNWVRQYINQGSGFISIITNDGWWGDTSGHHQHFAYARLRAIEFRRWIVRSANNGISGIINPYGNVEVKTDYWKKTAFRYDVPIMDNTTLYTRWGDWFPYIMLLITLFGCLSLMLSRRTD